MNSKLKKVLIIFLILLLSAFLGLFLEIKNTSDYGSIDGEFDQITAEVKVYRDEKGIPTIIANNLDDLFFAQGYEMARDRLWQMEFLRAVASGELAELIGESLVESDIYLRTLSMRYIADYKYSIMPEKSRNILDRFVLGINSFIDTHPHNLPLEFTLIGSVPQQWTSMDVLGIQGVMSRTLSISGLNRELFRQDLMKAVGAEKALELFPIEYPDAASYYLAQESSMLTHAYSSNGKVDAIEELIGNIGFGSGIGSNNWVVSGSNTNTGKPMLANDPHLDLTTPSIWWQVQLIAPNFHVQGFSLPGAPGVVLGHNEYVAWGVTNTGTDAVDLFYFNTNDQDQYFYNNTWVDFEIETLEIKVNGGETQFHDLRRTVYGPVLDPDLFGTPEGETYVMRWTLLEKNPNEQIFRAILDLNQAENVDDVHEALRYWGVPGQNIIFATMDGDIGYQYTGFIPIRKNNNYGVLPQNGSSNDYGWEGYIPYEDHYYVVNPEKGYFSTANEQIDPRNDFYITDTYDVGFRGARIKEVLDANSDITLDDMKNLQDDTKTLYADEMLDPFVLAALGGATFVEDVKTMEKAVEYLEDWTDRSMDRDSIGATLFATFQIYFEEFTFADELNAVEANFYNRYAGSATRGLRPILNNSSSIWYDDVTTTKIENGEDIAIKALEATVEFLSEEIGVNIDAWEYGKIHKVVFAHVMGDQTNGLLNEGDTPSDGSSYTVKAAGGTPRYTVDGPEFVQTTGPSMRFIAEVEPTWDNLYGVLSPGASGHFLNKHRGDGVDDWVNNVYHKWEFYTTTEETPDFTYKLV